MKRKKEAAALALAIIICLSPSEVFAEGEMPDITEQSIVLYQSVPETAESSDTSLIENENEQGVEWVDDSVKEPDIQFSTPYELIAVNPEPTVEDPEKQPKEASEAEQLSWPAEATEYDFSGGYSEDRERLVAIVLTQISCEDETAPEALYSPQETYEQWLRDFHPDISIQYGEEGWNTLFLCWCAAQVGLTEAGQFPITLSSEALEFYLETHGHLKREIREYVEAECIYTFSPGNLLFTPLIGDDSIEYGQRVGIITAVDQEHIEVVFGDFKGEVVLKSYLLEDICMGNDLIGAQVMEYRYRTVAEALFDFCLQELELNEAAACGILANALAESGFAPEKLGDNGFSIGLFQWQGQRREALNAFCKVNELDPCLVSSQLTYFSYEIRTIYPKTCEACKGVDNNASGASLAANIFCQNYEAPFNRFWNGKQRALTAGQTVWPLFCFRGIY